MNVGTITVGAADGSFSFVVPANCYSAARKPNCFAGGLHFRYALLFTAKSGPEEGKGEVPDQQQRIQGAGEIPASGTALHFDVGK